MGAIVVGAAVNAPAAGALPFIVGGVGGLILPTALMVSARLLAVLLRVAFWLLRAALVVALILGAIYVIARVVTG